MEDVKMEERLIIEQKKTNDHLDTIENILFSLMIIGFFIYGALVS